MLVPKDKAVRIHRTPQVLRLEWKWRWQESIGPILVGSMLGGSLVAAGFTGTGPNLERLPPIWGLIATGAAIFGAFAYVAATFCVNRTSILTDRDRIVVKHGPLPLLRRRHDENGTKQFYLKGAMQSSASMGALALHLVDNDDQEVFLAKNFPSRTAAMQVWAELQEFHGLEDLPVLGEVSHGALLDQRSNRPA
ncbi:MAG: hypothetical protein JSS66_18800 [Armatimonadetes bacterium]|nr:hypothetical protein [Armatimonadota bacterium]